MTLTLATLAAKIEATDEIIQAWNEKPDPHLMMTFKGRRIAAVSQEIYTALDEVFEMTLTSDVEEMARSVVLAIDYLDQENHRWLEQLEIDPELSDPSGSRELWARWSAVVEELRVAQTPLAKPEPIKALQTNKVSLEQIATIYGWKNASGNYDTWKVQEELDNPGTHYNPETWVHPSLQRRLNEVAKQWKLRTRSAAGEATSSGSRREAPETLEELIRQGVPSQQIARMKNVAVDVVRAEASRLNIPLDGTFVPRIQPVDVMQGLRDDEAAMAAEAQAAMIAESQPKSAIDRLAQLADAGATPDQMIDTLQRENPKMSQKQVEKLIKGALASSGV